MKNTVVTFKQAKEKGERISMLTAYDYSTAKLMDKAGINGILVGDSLGMVCLGYEDTISVTMEDMIHHTKAEAKLKQIHRNCHQNGISPTHEIHQTTSIIALGLLDIKAIVLRKRDRADALSFIHSVLCILLAHKTDLPQASRNLIHGPSFADVAPIVAL